MAESRDAAYIRFLDRTSTQRGQRHHALELLELAPGKRCLDLGCGTGQDRRAMAEAFGAEAAGVDVNPRMVAEAQSRSAGLDGVTFQVADGSDLPFPNAAFDAAWIKRTLMHIADPSEVLTQMVRVVKPGGRVVAVEPDLELVVLDSSMADVTRRVLARHSAGYANPWAGRQLRRLMLEAGLSEVQVVAEPTAIPDLAMTEVALRLISHASSAVSDGVLTEAEARQWEEDLRTKDERGLFSCHALVFVAYGRVRADTPAD